jgi:hypothetical protein
MGYLIFFQPAAFLPDFVFGVKEKLLELLYRLYFMFDMRACCLDVTPSRDEKIPR